MSASALSLFEATGIELEYMVVDRATLRVRPIVDLLFRDLTGEIVGDLERGDVGWSNELTAHVVELKTARPIGRLAGFADTFAQMVRLANQTLAAHGAMLLPTAAHPLMNPHTDTVLWQHEHSEVYELYNTIFDCRGHGWSNLQSMHLNLPFHGDNEFARLHAAVRVLLPIIPVLSASSPILDGQVTGLLDTRMEYYRANQQRVPQLMGALIPEAVSSQAEYEARIFGPIRAALAPYDPRGILNPHFANSRGAIARFDRGAIEIRVIDLQECPAADLAIAEAIIAAAQALCSGRWSSAATQDSWHERDLLAVFLNVIRAGGAATVEPRFARLWGLDTSSPVTVSELWCWIVSQVQEDISPQARVLLQFILTEGCLSQRLLRRLETQPGQPVSGAAIEQLYRELAVCLEKNEPLRGQPCAR